MSSAGAVRTSTGKLTRSGERSTIAFTSRSAPTAASRGSAYSISTKRTRRGDGEDLVRECPCTCGRTARGWRSWRSPGWPRGRPGRANRPAWKTPLDSSSSSIQPLTVRAGRRGRRCGCCAWCCSCRCAGTSRTRSARSPRRAVEFGRHPVEGHRLLAGRQQEDRLHGEGDRGDDAERAEPDPGRREDVRILLLGAGQHRAVRRDQLQCP